MINGADMKELTIHPKTMSKEDSIILADLFKQFDHLSVFDPGVYIHKFTDPETNESETYSITLEEKIIKRPSEHAPLENRYEVFSEIELVGAGGFSEVYPVICTLEPLDYNNGLLVKTYKDRVVKKQHHTQDELPFAEKEYQLTKQAGNVHAKKPAIAEGEDDEFTSYTVMRKLKGTDLMDILNQLYTETINLSTYKRLTIAMLLLKKIEELHQHGIIHRDLKPDNVMLEIDDNNSFELFDYGLSKFINEVDLDEAQGSVGYIAPEVMRGEGTDEKSDLFSAAIIIGMLWFADPIQDQDVIEAFYSFPNLFKDKSVDLTYLEKSLLTTMLQHMTLSEQAARPTVKEALNQLTALRDNYVNRKTDELSAEKKRARNTARLFQPKAVKQQPTEAASKLMTSPQRNV